jgi:hypothetical protein
MIFIYMHVMYFATSITLPYPFSPFLVGLWFELRLHTFFP